MARDVELVVQVLFLEKGQHANDPSAAIESLLGDEELVARLPAECQIEDVDFLDARALVIVLINGKVAVLIVVVERSQREILDVIDATHAPRGLAGRLHRGQEQGDQDADHSDHHEQLDEREC